MTGLKQIGALRFARELTERGIPFWARYVLIPGHTDSDRDISMLADWAAGMPTLAGVELLPYHLYGKNKWEALGLKYPLEGVETPPPAAVRAVVERLEAAGLNVLCDAKAPPALSSAHTGPGPLLEEEVARARARAHRGCERPLIRSLNFCAWRVVLRRNHAAGAVAAGSGGARVDSRRAPAPRLLL